MCVADNSTNLNHVHHQLLKKKRLRGRNHPAQFGDSSGSDYDIRSRRKTVNTTSHSEHRAILENIEAVCVDGFGFAHSICA